MMNLEGMNDDDDDDDIDDDDNPVAVKRGAPLI